nr:zinc finger, CCHC-type [Tanacetum cinerariifolium]
MSDSDESGVTYTDISSPFEELSDIGSPRANDHEHFELPEMLEDPYVEAPPSPDYVPGPKHADDEIVAEDQPYAEDASPIAQLPEYVPESNFEAHPEDDDDEDPEEDPVDYLADGGDDGDDEEESSEDDEDDDMDIEADEEEEHPAPSDYVVVASTAADQAPSVEETEPFETDESAATPPPHPAYRMTTRISIPAPVPMENRPEVTLPPQKRLGIALGPRYEGAPVSTDTELDGYMREFETRVRQDTDEIYMRLDDEQTERQLLAGWLNMLFRDRRAHAYTRHLMETEARMSREAWVRSTDASDLVRGEVMSLRTTVLGQMTEIKELQAVDRRRQTVISELLRTDHRRSTEITELRTALQGQMTVLQAQVTALQGQQGLAGGPTQPELPEEAVSINSIIGSRYDIFNENRFSLVPKPSLKSPNRTKGNGGSVIPKEVTEGVVQQPKHELRKSKRNKTPKNFGLAFQLYLIKGTRDKVSDQHSYCFNVEDDPKTFDEAMKSQDVAF